MNEYVAVYKCRLCGEIFTDSLVLGEEAVKCLTMFDKGKTHYRSCSGRNDVYKCKGHYCCKDDSIGLSDFQGFKKMRDYSCPKKSKKVLQKCSRKGESYDIKY